MKFSVLTILATLTLAAQAQAYELRDCATAGVDLTTIVAPAAKNSRNFAKMKVSVYNIDTEEPAAASAGIAIVVPDFVSEVGGAKCYTVTGFRSIDVMKARVSYDSAKGLLLSIPNTRNINGDTAAPGADAKILINLRTYSVTLVGI